MSTADKLNHLLNCKDAIKNAIRDKGVEIDNETKLSEYAGKISEISVGDGNNHNHPDFFDIRTKGNTNYSYLFCNLTRDYSELDIANWDTSSVENLSYTFYCCGLDIGKLKWDTSNVKDFSYFLSCFKGSIDITNLDFISATNVSYMFEQANLNNIKGIENLNLTPGITSLKYMFKGAVGDSLNLSNWDMSSVIDMNNMFNSHNLKKIDLSNWDTGSVTDMRYMFGGYTNTLEELIIPDWNMNRCNSYGDFISKSYNNNLYYIDMSRSDDHTITKVASCLPTRTESKYGEIAIPENSSQTVIDGVISKYWRPIGPDLPITNCEIAAELDEVILGNTTKIHVGNMDPWYGSKEKLKFEVSDESIATIDGNGILTANKLGDVEIHVKYNDHTVSNFITVSVSKTDSYPNVVKFKGTSSPSTVYNYIYVNGNSATNKVYLNDMNYNSISGIYTYDAGEPITSIKFNGYGSNHTDAVQTCTEIIKLNTSNINDATSMFGYCSGIKSLELSDWNTENVSIMNYMFVRCYSLISLDIRNFNISDGVMVNSFLGECNSLKTLRLDNCNNLTISKIIKVFGFPTFTDGSEHNIYVQEANVQGLTPPKGWDFVYVTADKPEPGLENLTINPLKEDIYVGDEIQLTFNYSPEDYDTNRMDLEWSIIDGEKYAGIKEINDDGCVISALESGMFTVQLVDKNTEVFSKVTLEVLKTIDPTLKVRYVIENPDDKPEFNDDFKYDLESKDNGDGTYTVSIYSKEDFTEFRSNDNTIAIKFVDLCNVRETKDLFDYNHSLRSVNLSNLTNAYDIGNMFHDCYELRSLNLSNLNLLPGYNTSMMFKDCNNLNEIRLDNCNRDTIEAVISSERFPSDNEGTIYVREEEVQDLNLFVGNWHFEFVEGTEDNLLRARIMTSMSGEYPKLEIDDESDYDCEMFETVNGDGTYTVSVYSKNKFGKCKFPSAVLKMIYLDITEKCETLENAFSGCNSLEYINASRWDISNVNNMINMFSGCSNLMYLYINNWDLSYATLDGIFDDCYNLTDLYCNNANSINALAQYLPDSFGTLYTTCRHGEFDNAAIGSKGWSIYYQ